MMYDLFIIGGGINGCGIARDAAGRGLKTYLVEQNDLASGTSSASTKLIHGGLRYLEHYEFRLVREALKEREVLMQSAPHIIWPLRFVLPYHKGLRPWPILRLGLFLYDNIGGRKMLPGTRSVNFQKDVTGKPLKKQFVHGYEYSDCWVDDSRLVVLNARDAVAKGAVIKTRTKCIEAKRVENLWQIVTQDELGKMQTIKARLLINAGGPWVSQILGQVLSYNDPDKIRMVKGSHIVVRKLYNHDRCYIFQNGDGRICFTIPYETDYTLIGTTDEDHKGDPGKPEISSSEINYMINAVSEYFKTPVTKEDIIWTYSGIRPLYDDGASKAQEATRDYVLKLETQNTTAPALSIFGGKITTYRKLAEAALEKISTFFPQMGKPWTQNSPLPGGEFDLKNSTKILQKLEKKYPFIDPSNLARMFRAYGTDINKIFANVQSKKDLGKNFGPLYECEINWLKQEEFAQTADDILWRRSKLGLHLSKTEIAALNSHIKASKN